MGSNSPSSVPEIVLPLSSQKHDPAWKHCLMIKKGEKTHLKCMYCVKIFSGGGIHRIKEHLACQKGNASSCSKVPPDVRRAMLQSLECVVVRKKKKQRLAEEVKKLNTDNPAAIQPETDNGVPLLALPVDAMGADLYNQEKKEDTMAVAKMTRRGRRRRAEASHAPSTCGLIASQAEHGAKEKDGVYMAIGRFLYEAGVPLDAVNSVNFQAMIDAIVSAGTRIEAPSYQDVRGWMLKNALGEVRNKLEHWKMTWGRTGCSILADEWTTEMDRTFINFLVYCPEGTVFLKSVDASQIITSADALYELLRHLVEEVGVKNVVQVITNTTETHAIAGKKLTETFPTLFWTPCSTRCVDMMLDDFGKLEHIADILDQAKSITSFIYSHASVLNMMKRYTGGKDLLHPCISTSGTNFIALKNFTSLRENLQLMIMSQEWMDSAYSKEPMGSVISDIICSHSFWSSCMAIVRITEPLVRVLQIANSNLRPAMGYMHMSMCCAKESIKRELKKKSYYVPYWNIIDWRWEQELARPLHMAGFFLNPQFFYKIQGEIPNEIMSGMLDCIERLVPDMKVQDKINKELSLYKSAAGDFGRKMAVRARDTLLPAEWWSTYGAGCPNLARLAIRILSQTCSASACERNHIAFEQIHNQRMNNLEHQRLNDLIFVRYNLRLQQKKGLKRILADPTSIDNISNAEDWVTEKSELFSMENSSWMDLTQPFDHGMPPEHANDEEADPFMTGFDDGGIPSVVDDEDEEEDDNDVVKEEDDGMRDIKGDNEIRHGTMVGEQELVKMVSGLKKMDGMHAAAHPVLDDFRNAFAVIVIVIVLPVVGWFQDDI